MPYDIAYATVHSTETVGEVRKGSKVAELMSDAGGGTGTTTRVEGPFVYHKENNHNAPEVGKVYSITFRRAKDMAQFIWRVTCISRGALEAADGGYLTFEKID
jgi:hypothetical protein